MTTGPSHADVLRTNPVLRVDGRRWAALRGPARPRAAGHPTIATRSMLRARVSSSLFVSRAAGARPCRGTDGRAGGDRPRRGSGPCPFGQVLGAARPNLIICLRRRGQMSLYQRALSESRRSSFYARSAHSGRSCRTALPLVACDCWSLGTLRDRTEWRGCNLKLRVSVVQIRPRAPHQPNKAFETFEQYQLYTPIMHRAACDERWEMRYI